MYRIALLGSGRVFILFLAVSVTIVSNAVDLPTQSLICAFATYGSFINQSINTFSLNQPDRTYSSR